MKSIGPKQLIDSLCRHTGAQSISNSVSDDLSANEEFRGSSQSPGTYHLLVDLHMAAHNFLGDNSSKSSASLGKDILKHYADWESRNPGRLGDRNAGHIHCESHRSWKEMNLEETDMRTNAATRKKGDDEVIKRKGS